MKKVALILIILGLVNLFNQTTNSESNETSGKSQSVPDRILVKYKKQANLSIQQVTKTTIEANYGLQKIRNFSFIDVYLYNIYWDKEKTLMELNKNPNIEYAEPDYIVHVDSTIPNDPNLDKLWGLNNTGQTEGTMDADIDAPGAWDLATGSNNVIVAVIDTGVDYNHEDLKANMWINHDEIPDNAIDDDDNGYVDDYYGINAINDSGDPMDDEEGHGTHCAGTIAAIGNNGIGVVGVCWTAKIMALKSIASKGGASISDGIKCIEYAINKGAHIINASYGGPNFSQAEKDAINSAKSAGILFIASAGNDGWNLKEIPHYPACHDCNNIIAVAATDHNDNLASFSNYGSNSVDVAAPGELIYSTVPNNSYNYKEGTSMATPHVAGLGALIKSYYPSLNWEQIKDSILNGVDQIDSLENKILTAGRINAFKSLYPGGAASYTLTVQSSPSSGAYIEVNPDDLKGQGNGNTNFTRTYAPDTTVSLTAPLTHAGRNFGYWALEGSKYSENRSTSISIEYNHIIEAVYPLYTLKIESTPNTGIKIKVSPNDENGKGDGTTNFSRKYQHGATVTLTAPSESKGKKFAYWIREGESSDDNLTTTITVNNDCSITAFYSDIFKWRLFLGYDFLGEPLQLSATPAISSDGTIYINAGTSLFAISPDGTKKWEFMARGGGNNSSPAIGSDGTIYFAGGRFLYAIDPEGTKKWEFETFEFIRSSPAIGSDGIIYFGSGDYNFYALDSSGNLKWKFGTTANICSSPAIASDGTIYFLSNDSHFYALDASGNLKWKYKTGGNRCEFYSMSPAIASDSTIYFGYKYDSFYALYPDGNLKWKYDSKSYPYSSPTIGSDGTIYFGGFSCSDGINAIDANGNFRWRYSLDSTISNSLAIGSDGSMYLGCYNYFYAFDNSGNLKWKFPVEGENISSSPGIRTSATIAPDGTIYFGTWDGYLYAIKSDSLGLANSPWPKFRKDIKNTGKIPSATDNPPSVSIISPSEGDPVAQFHNIKATALDDNEVSKVEFYIDDVLKSTDTISPYTYSWDTSRYSMGTHKIKAKAYDNINQTNYQEISVEVTHNPNPTISGCVKHDMYKGGEGFEGVTITFSNGGGTETTDIDGNYSHNVSYGWSGTATPSHEGYGFGPDNRNYTNVTSNHTAQNYTGYIKVYTITGNVSEITSSGKKDLSGVIMKGLPWDPKTDSNGNYTAYIDHGWSGTVIPTKNGYTFSPSSRSYTNVSSMYENQDYTATLSKLKISGSIKNEQEEGIEVMQMSLLIKKVKTLKAPLYLFEQIK